MTKQYATESISAVVLFHPSISRSQLHNGKGRGGFRTVISRYVMAAVTESKSVFSMPSTLPSIRPAVDYPSVTLSLLPVFGYVRPVP